MPCSALPSSGPPSFWAARPGVLLVLAFLPILVRAVSVADAFDAMTSERPYRPSLPVERALTELRDGNNVQFDPDVVEAFVRAYPSAKQLPIATPALRPLRLPENVVPA